MVIIIGAKTTIVSHKAHKRGWFRGGFHAKDAKEQRTLRVSREGRKEAKNTARRNYFVVPAAPPCSPRETFSNRGFHAKGAKKQRTQRGGIISLCPLLRRVRRVKPVDSDKTFGTGHFYQPRFIQSVDNKFFVSGTCIETYQI